MNNLKREESITHTTVTFMKMIIIFIENIIRYTKNSLPHMSSCIIKNIKMLFYKIK